jgi:hypothetical protein
MLLNKAAHNVSIQNVKVSKRERHITYSVTKNTASYTFGTSLLKVRKIENFFDSDFGICVISLLGMHK